VPHAFDSDVVASSPDYHDWRQVELAGSLKTYIAASCAIFLISCMVMLELGQFPSVLDFLVAVTSVARLLQTIHGCPSASRQEFAATYQNIVNEYKSPLAEWRQQNRLTYVVTQVGLLWANCSLITQASAALPSPVLRHRAFLFSYLMLVSKVTSLMDLRIVVYIFCIVIQFGWYIKFHKLVDFMPLPNMVGGGVVTTVGLMSFIHAEKLRRKTYAVLLAEDAAHKSLLARKDAFHRLLSGLFDATCICDMGGIVQADTPHFRQQFGTLIDMPLALIGSDMHSRICLADLVKLAKESGPGQATSRTLKLASGHIEGAVIHAQVLAVLHPAVLPLGKLDGQEEHVRISVQLESNPLKLAKVPPAVHLEDSVDKHSEYETCWGQSNTGNGDDIGSTKMTDSVSPWDSVSNCHRRFSHTKDNEAID